MVDGGTGGSGMLVQQFPSPQFLVPHLSPALHWLSCLQPPSFSPHGNSFEQQDRSAAVESHVFFSEMISFFDYMIH